MCDWFGTAALSRNGPDCILCASFGANGCCQFVSPYKLFDVLAYDALSWLAFELLMNIDVSKRFLPIVFLRGSHMYRWEGPTSRLTDVVTVTVSGAQIVTISPQQAQQLQMGSPLVRVV